MFSVNSCFNQKFKMNLLLIYSCVCVSPPVSSLCNSAPGSGPSSPNSSNTAIANGNTGSVPNIQTEVHVHTHTGWLHFQFFKLDTKLEFAPCSSVWSTESKMTIWGKL